MNPFSAPSKKSWGKRLSDLISQALWVPMVVHSTLWQTGKKVTGQPFCMPRILFPLRREAATQGVQGVKTDVC